MFFWTIIFNLCRFGPSTLLMHCRTLSRIYITSAVDTLINLVPAALIELMGTAVLACMLTIEFAPIMLGVTPVCSILAIPVPPDICPVMSAYPRREETRFGKYPVSVISWRHVPAPTTVKIVIIIDKNHIKWRADCNIVAECRREDKLRLFINYDFRLFWSGWRNNHRRRWRSYYDSWWARYIDVDINSGIHRGSDTQQECDD